MKENKTDKLYETENYYVALGIMKMINEKPDAEEVVCYQIKNKRNDMIELETLIEAQAIKHIIDLETALGAHREMLDDFLRTTRNSKIQTGNKIVNISPTH